MIQEPYVLTAYTCVRPALTMRNGAALIAVVELLRILVQCAMCVGTVYTDSFRGIIFVQSELILVHELGTKQIFEEHSW
jgi:tRNA(Arg) A34 adenosine deaminase TadA